MMTTRGRTGALAIALLLGVVTAACAEDSKVSSVRSEQGGGGPDVTSDSVPAATTSTAPTEATEPEVTLPELTLPSVPTTEDDTDDTATDDTATEDTEYEGPVVEVPSELTPMGDPAASAFSWEDSFSSGDTLDAFLAGVVELPLDDYEERDGRCFAAVGSFTGTALSEGLVVSSFRTPPLYGAVAGGIAESGFGSCDTTSLETAGYEWTYDVATTIGTTYLFYEPFFVVGADATLDAVVVGDVYFGEDLTFYDATSIDAPPALTTQVGPSVADGLTLTPVGDPSLSTFTYASEYSPDDAWSGTIAGLVELPVYDYSAETGHCYALLGTLVPTKVEEGTTSSPYTTPEFSVIADGREMDSGFGTCDEEALDAAGYGWFLDAEVEVGSTYWFYSPFFIPGDALPRMEVVAVGSTTDADHVLFAPTVLPEVPAVG